MLPSQLPAASGMFVAVDCETSGLHPDDGARVSVVSVAWTDEESRVRSFAWPFDQGILDKLEVVQGELSFEEDPNLDEAEWVALLDWLARQRLIFHNAPFDLRMLRAGTRKFQGRDLERWLYWDTALVVKLLDPISSGGLKETAERWGLQGGGERDKQEVLKEYLRKQRKRLGPGLGDRYDLVPWSIMEPYARVDAVLTILLFEHQVERVSLGEARTFDVLHDLDVCRALYRMEIRGVNYDVAASLHAAGIIDRAAKAIEKQLPFRATTPAAKEYFFKVRGVPAYKRTPTGAPVLDDEVTYRLQRDGVMWAEEWALYTKLQKASSMWYRGYPASCGPDSKLRATYKQTRVKSGRFSVERVQLHAIPKEDKALDLPGVPSVRALIRPDCGYEMWNLDLSQAELRVAAKMCGCEAMLEMLEGGADLHGVTTREVFGIGPDHPDFKVKRDVAKRLTFGSIFQIGPKTFQATLAKAARIEWPLSQCEQAVHGWRHLYPEFSQAYYWSDRFATTNGWVWVMEGTQWARRSHFGPLDYSNTAWSRRVQGSLALFNGIWLIETERKAPGALVMNVHDSQVLHLPEDGAERVAHTVAEHGAELATKLFDVTMKVDVNRWAYGEEIAA